LKCDDIAISLKRVKSDPDSFNTKQMTKTSYVFSKIRWTYCNVLSKYWTQEHDYLLL